MHWSGPASNRPKVIGGEGREGGGFQVQRAMKLHQKILRLERERLPLPPPVFTPRMEEKAKRIIQTTWERRFENPERFELFKRCMRRCGTDPDKPESWGQ